MSDQLREDRFKMGLTRPFADRFNRFVENSGGAVEPLQGRIDPNEYKTVYNSLTQSDPELAAEMGNVHESPFIRGNAAMVHYPVNDQWAMKNASRYGLRLRPGFNNIVEPTGLRHKNRPTDFSTMSSDQIKNHLMEIIEGAVQPDIDDDRNPEALSLDAPLLANQSPTPQIDPTAFRDPDKARSSWDEAVDWWLSHNFFDEDVPSGGGLMVGPQEMAKLGNFLKDALLPLMAGDIGLAGVGGLGPFDPVPVPFGQIVGKGAKGAKGIWRVIRGADEAVEAGVRAVRSVDEFVDAADAAWPGGPKLFHGTSDSFDTFTARNRPLLSGLGVQGTHVTPVEQIAAHYGGEAGGRVISVEWALDRPPRILDTAGPLPDDLVDAASELLTPAQAAELRTYGTLREVLTLGDVRPGQVGAPDEGAVAQAVRAKLSELYDVTLERVMPLAGGDGSPEYIFLNPDDIRIGATRLLGNAPVPAGDDIWEDPALAGYEPSDPPGVEGPPGGVARETGGKPAAPTSAVDDLPVPEEYLGDLSALYEKGTGEVIIANPTVGDLVAKADELEGEFWAKIEPGFESVNKIHADDSLIGIDPNESAEYIYTSVKGGGPQSIFRQLTSQGEVEVPYIVSNKAWEAGDDLWEAYVDDFLTRYPDQDPIIFLSREVEEFPTDGIRESGMPWSHLDAVGQSVREWLEGYALRKTARTVMEGGK